MKPSLTPFQAKLLGVSAGILLITVAVNWWGISTQGDASDKAQQFLERRGKAGVAELLGGPGGISDGKKELKKMEELATSVAKQEDAIVGPWRAATGEAAGLGKDWSKDPNKWKDLLVKYTDEVLKKSGKGADKKHVNCPPGFYLGLEDFKQKSPKEEQVPSLALQLSVSKRLVDLLFMAKENAREGYPTTCTLLNLKGPVSENVEAEVDAKQKGKPAGQKSSSRGRYSIEFESSPEVFYNYVSALTKDDYFLIPVSVSIENEKLSFPKRSELAGQFASTSSDNATSHDSPQGGPRTTNPPLLLVLAGKERIRVQMEIDFVQWKSPAMETPAPKNAKP